MTRMFEPDLKSGSEPDFASGLNRAASQSFVNETEPQKRAGSEFCHSLKDFVQATFYTSIGEPVLGVAQICDKTAGTHLMAKAKGTLAELGISAPEKATSSVDGHAQMLGNAVGMMLPYLMLHQAVRGGATKALGEEAFAAKADLGLLSGKQFGLMTAKEAGLSFATGFTYDAALRPSNNDQTGAGFIKDRFLNGVTGGATMAALAASSFGLGRLASSEAIEPAWAKSMLTNLMSAGVISAVPAGLVQSEADALRQGKVLPTAADAGQSIYQMAFVGLALGGAHLLAAQHEGIARTNVDHYVTDPIERIVAGTDTNSDRQRDFKLATTRNGAVDFNGVMQRVRNGEAVTVPVREYLGKGAFGGGLLSGRGFERLGLWGDKFGDVRNLLISAQPGGEAASPQAGLIAKCEILDENLKPRGVFQGKGPVHVSWNPDGHSRTDNSPSRISFSLDPLSEQAKAKGWQSEHLGKNADAAEQGLEAPAQAAQVAAQTIANPYLDAYNSLAWLQQIREHTANNKMRYADDNGNGESVHVIRERYAYAVPTEQAIDAIHKYSDGKVIEIGAGRGYWASLLRQRGTDVAAYDKLPPGSRGNIYIGLGNNAYTNVEKGGIEMIRKHPENSLLLVWPPPNDPMASNALLQYKGRYVMFAGELDGTTGSLRFADLLRSRWQEVHAVELPHFPSYDDDLTIYERKPKSAWDPDFEQLIKQGENR